jgi:hypothetical protein
MPALLVTYDLRAPGRNYQRLLDYLQKYPSIRVVESSWMISTSETAMQVCDEIASYVDSNDRVFVGEVTRNAAWLHLPDAVTAWLNTYLEDVV